MAEVIDSWPQGPPAAWEYGATDPGPAPAPEDLRCECGGMRSRRATRCWDCHLAAVSQNQQRIRVMRAQGDSPEVIAKALCCSVSTVKKVKR